MMHATTLFSQAHKTW